jgi:hypothetical protein
MDEIPPYKRPLARKLLNVGVWPRRIPALLRRFSAGRIEENFQLYRQRAAEETIHRPGAWLDRAITQGFTGYTAGEPPPDASDGSLPPSGDEGALPPLSDRTRVSKTVKSAYVQRGTPESAFHERPDVRPPLMDGALYDTACRRLTCEGPVRLGLPFRHHRCYQLRSRYLRRPSHCRYDSS